MIEGPARLTRERCGLSKRMRAQLVELVPWLAHGATCRAMEHAARPRGGSGSNEEQEAQHRTRNRYNNYNAVSTCTAQLK